jgi:hypothetical protein
MSQYVLVGCPDANIKIDRELLAGCRGIENVEGALWIDIPGATIPVLFALRKILSDLVLIPTVDLSSHLEVMMVVNTARSIGLKDEKLYSGSFKGWTESREWVNLRLPEYMWVVWTMIEELVDFRKYVRLAHNPFDMVLRTLELPEVKSDPANLFRAMMYFSEFKLELCFDMNNDKVQSHLTRLRADLERTREHFLIDPHVHTGYFAATESAEEKWNCSQISAVSPPSPGACTIVDMDTANERFLAFTCGLFKAPLNPRAVIQFPWDNVVFAGGGATKILSADYNPKNARQSDVDLFIIGTTFEERKKALDEVIEWFNTFGEERSRSYYAIRGSVITIYVSGVNRKVQLISSNAKNVYEVIGKFDLTHIQWGMWRGRYYGTPQAAAAMRSKVTRFSNTRMIKPYRLIKAMTCGYSVEKSREICESIIDITSIVEGDNEQLQGILRDFHGYYYPTPLPDYDPEDELKHILAMICKDANASMATNDPSFVRQNVVVSGNFNDSYESISFTTFNPGLIMNKGQGRRITSTMVKTRHGTMRLTSDFLTIKRVVANEGISITMSAPSDQFIEFTKLLEGNVYRMFRQGGVTRKLFNESREITLTIPQHSVDAQISRGFSIIRNQRGLPLNIEEDLHPGDKVQFMFLVEMLMTDQVRAVNLKPIKFIKYDTGTDCAEDCDDIDAEVNAVETETAVEIKYEEVL